MAHGSVHREPAPVNPAQLIKPLHSCLPELEKDGGFHPLLKAIMCSGMRTQLGLVQSLPLAARSQHIKDGISTSSIGHSWASPAKSMRVDVDWQEGMQLRPQILGDPRILSWSGYSEFAHVCAFEFPAFSSSF